MENNIIIINGPNLNLLGEREKNKYGTMSLKEIENNCLSFCKKNGLNLTFYQSNIEGEIVEKSSAEEVFNNPKHRYTKKLISSVPKINDIG